METAKRLEEAIYSCPLVLLGASQEELNVCNNYLPYSTGFEIECDTKNGNEDDCFKTPNILAKPNGREKYEIRFRIPNGLKGLLCLYDISVKLKLFAELNSGSGIHYHVDCTDVNMNEIKKVLSSDALKEAILNELDSWEYGGSYNQRNIGGKGNWLAIRANTLEFRLGNMTFDYEVLSRRIIHANDIVRRIKEIAGYDYKPDFDNTFNKSEVIASINASLSKHQTSYGGELADRIRQLKIKLNKTENVANNLNTRTKKIIL